MLLFRTAGVIGILFFLVWSTCSVALLVDTAVTGAAEWAWWAEEAAVHRTEYLTSYALASLIGVFGLVSVVRWTIPFLHK